MAVFDQEYMSIDAFLNARLCSMSMGQKADRDYDAMRSDRRRLYRQLSAFGIDKNLFKWHSKSRVFYVTPKAAALFELLFDIEAEGQCGKPFDPQKLDAASVIHLRSQLLEALLSYHISGRHIMRTLQNYDRAVDFRLKIQQIRKPSERHQNNPRSRRAKYALTQLQLMLINISLRYGILQIKVSSILIGLSVTVTSAYIRYSRDGIHFWRSA